MQKPNNRTSIINEGAAGAVIVTKTSDSIRTGGYGTAKAFLDVTAISGASASLTVKFQDSADGTHWVDVASGSMTAVTATGNSSIVLANVGPYVHAVQTVAGTTPSITYDLIVSGIN